MLLEHVSAWQSHRHNMKPLWIICLVVVVLSSSSLRRGFGRVLLSVAGADRVDWQRNGGKGMERLFICPHSLAHPRWLAVEGFGFQVVVSRDGESAPNQITPANVDWGSSHPIVVYIMARRGCRPAAGSL